MSLVNKIPPLISALAFGYGVGMAAPESTISSVHAAVAVYQQPGGIAKPAAVVAPRPLPAPPRVTATGLGGDESRELARLRDAAKEPRRAESSDRDRPTYSRPPRYVSEMDRVADDADDLDSAGAEALSRLQLPDLRVPVTRRTLKYVRFFTRSDRGRGMFETWLKRSGRYQEIVEGELRARSLPEDLIWVAMIESGFDPRARSPAGAVGLWQFMPATGSVYGLQQSRFLDQRKNPRLATQAAAHHLRDLYLRFGTWDLALAAYNMGYEQLLDAIDKYGTADFNELARQEAIPAETAAYVPKILAAAIVANNLERFGFDKVEVARPVDSAEIAVPPGTPLKTLAKAAGVATSALRTLNPDLLGERVPPGRGDYVVMIPADTVSRARAALPSMLENEPIDGDDAAVLDPVSLLGGRELARKHAAREDDSLLSLLPRPKHRGTFRDPQGDDDDGAAVARDDDDGGDREIDLGHALAGDRDEATPRRALGHHARHGRETVMYRVGPGDTLAGVARQFAVDADDVSRTNHLDEGDLKVGGMLRLRVRRDLLEKVGSVEEARPSSKEKEGREPASTRAHRGDGKDEAPARKHHGRPAHKDPT